MVATVEDWTGRSKGEATEEREGRGELGEETAGEWRWWVPINGDDNEEEMVLVKVGLTGGIDGERAE